VLQQTWSFCPVKRSSFEMALGSDKLCYVNYKVGPILTCSQFPLRARLTEHGAVTAVRGMIVVGPVVDRFDRPKAY